MLLFITAVSVVLVASFLCSIFESVLLSVTRPQVEVLARSGRRAGTLLADFKANMDVPIAAILILNTAAHTVGAAVAGASYSNVFDASTLWLFSILFTLAVLLFTEIIPKTLGVSYAQTLATPVAYGIHWLTIVLRPLVYLSERISRSLRRSEETPVTSPEEIRLLAFLGMSEGAVGSRTAGMIVGATQLQHLQAHDVMLPRTEIQYLSGTMSREEAITLARETGHSRFPFSPSGKLQDINSVIFVKELQYWLLANDHKHVDWEQLKHDTLIVPETLPLPKLLRTFQTSHRHLAMVVDEYGDIQGLATLEDVLEEIVGDIRDESDRPTKDLLENDDGSLTTRGTVDLRTISLALNIPWEPEDDVTTISGLVTETLERIPKIGETISWHGYEIRVIRADRKRATVLKIQRLPGEQA
ncbi:MAG: hemolysin family protein [Pseudomonadota bacterium]